MNMEEIRKLVKDLFERHGEELRGHQFLSARTVVKVTNGEWDFAKYHSITGNRRVGDNILLDPEKFKFVFRHARFLIAYCDYAIQNLSSEHTVSIFKEIKARKIAYKILERLSESVEGS